MQLGAEAIGINLERLLENYKRKYSSREITDWLKAEYSSHFAANFYDQEKNSEIEKEFSLIKEISENVKNEANPERKAALESQSYEHLYRMSDLNWKQGKKTIFATFGFLLDQLIKYQEPELPIEIWEYLELEYELDKRRKA